MMMRQRMTAGGLAAAIAACGLVAAVMPASLEELKQRMEPITCANNLRVCHQAWTVYGAQYDGVWMAPWDRRLGNSWPGVSFSNSWVMMWPYTMVHYVIGGGLPPGEVVYDGLWTQKGYAGPWYGPDGRHGHPPSYTGSADGPDAARPLHCASIVRLGPEANLIWYNTLSYSYAIMGAYEVSSGRMYGVSGYPKPGLMTHPATTILLHDMAVVPGEVHPNAWSIYWSNPLDPHGGKSNYVMCDGHVELMPPEALEERMWQSLWTPESPTGEGTH